MTYKKYKKSALAGNPELRKEYEALAPQYDIIDLTLRNSPTQNKAT